MSYDVANSLPSRVSLHSITDTVQSDDRTLLETELQLCGNQARFEARSGRIDEKSEAEDVQVDPNVLAGKVRPPSGNQTFVTASFQ